uniref:Putative secreted protein n=1 Tax=Anopheles triannulatus TaxID=58253 RepID=A0A2M4B7C0_9DIPT
MVFPSALRCILPFFLLRKTVSNDILEHTCAKSLQGFLIKHFYSTTSAHQIFNCDQVPKIQTLCSMVAPRLR